MLLGIKALMQFDYVVFDNENYEVKFCSDGEFVPDDPGKWAGYKFSLEPDSSNNLRMMVTMPIAGKNRKMMFDTCGGYGLLVHPAVWEQMGHEFGKTDMKEGKFISGFQGWLPCRKGTVERLEIANRTVSNAQVVVPDESTSYLGSVEAVFSMDYFKDTQIVLDNVHGLMWVRK
jgi:hypothetical protein